MWLSIRPGIRRRPLASMIVASGAALRLRLGSDGQEATVADRHGLGRWVLAVERRDHLVPERVVRHRSNQTVPPSWIPAGRGGTKDRRPASMFTAVAYHRGARGSGWSSLRLIVASEVLDRRPSRQDLGKYR